MDEPDGLLLRFLQLFKLDRCTRLVFCYQRRHSRRHSKNAALRHWQLGQPAEGKRPPVGGYTHFLPLWLELERGRGDGSGSSTLLTSSSGAKFTDLLFFPDGDGISPPEVAPIDGEAELPQVPVTAPPPSVATLCGGCACGDLSGNLLSRLEGGSTSLCDGDVESSRCAARRVI